MLTQYISAALLQQRNTFALVWAMGQLWKEYGLELHWDNHSSMFMAALVLRCTPSAEKYIHMVSSIESRLGPSTQDKAERLMATTGHFFEHAMTAYLPPSIAGERRIFADTSRVVAGCP